MNNNPDDICAHGEYFKKTEEPPSERYTAKPDRGRDFSSSTKGTSSFVEPRSKNSLPLSKTNETFCVVQSVLLAFAILVLSYHGIRYGRTEFSLLDNGRIVNGFVSHNRAAVTLNLGYSPAYSAASSILAFMLLYSLVSKKPNWSLPSVIFCLADLIYDIGDVVVATWLFFGNLHFTTALLYTTGTIFVVLGEFWIWLGVLQLYEHRTCK